ncbi:hypothetical protein DV736_g5392, partial [Chaetothyriales sp. CBS 134916]
MDEAEKSDEVENEKIQETLSALGELEKGFADVELNYLRRKEFDLKPLYAKRSEALQKIPDFWSTVFLNAPEDIEQHYSVRDLEFLSAITSFSVERYQIKSHDNGEPRSLRFTFEFSPNDLFTDAKLVKEFEYVSSPDGAGNLISTPVPIKWKSKKKDPTDGLLDAAVNLYRAEQSMTLQKSGKTIEMVDREGLWQHEKLLEKIEKLDESGEEPSITRWFGFRGAVFAAGEEVAISLAEDLWSDALDYYMRANEEPDTDFAGFDEGDDEVDEDDDVELDPDDAPALVSAPGPDLGAFDQDVEVDAEEVELDSDAVLTRPAKKRRTD